MYSSGVRRKKWLIVGGVIVGGLAILMALVMFAPAPQSGFEPEWLLKIEPKSQKRTMSSNRGTLVGSGFRSVDMMITQKRWEVDEPIAEVVRKLDASFKATDGWIREVDAGNLVSWIKANFVNPEVYTVNILKVGESTHIHTSTFRDPNWLEKVQYSIRRFFGMEKK